MRRLSIVWRRYSNCRCLVLFVTGMLLFVAEAHARAGGGHSYSSGSSGHSSGDGDGGGIIIYYLFRFLVELTFNYPIIGIPLDIVVIVILIKLAQQRRASSDVVYASREVVPSYVQNATTELTTLDPSLSEVLFYDFIYTLYAQLHEARGRRSVKDLAPFISAQLETGLTQLSPASLQQVSGVIVGSCRIVGARLIGRLLEVNVDFETNYTESLKQEQRSWYCKERWVFERLVGFSAPLAEASSTSACPGCGAKAERAVDGSCVYCGEKSLTNQLGVRAVRFQIVRREQKPPLLTTNVAEQGTNYPTEYQDQIAKRLQSYCQNTPDFSEEKFLKRTSEIFLAIQAAWSSLAWEMARPYESDCLFQTHRFWIEEYRRQKLRNVLSDVEISSQAIVKVVSDPVYDAITLRIFASMTDYTIRSSDNQVVCGDVKSARRFSEYWTFIRKREVRGSKSEDFKCCPNCGAELKVSMSGLCEYCKAKITCADFGWIASRIEQDDAYQA